MVLLEWRMVVWLLGWCSSGFERVRETNHRINRRNKKHL